LAARKLCIQRELQNIFETCEWLWCFAFDSLSCEVRIKLLVARISRSEHEAGVGQGSTQGIRVATIPHCGGEAATHPYGEQIIKLKTMP
jgi:hypothetical protein